MQQHSGRVIGLMFLLCSILSTSPAIAQQGISGRIFDAATTSPVSALVILSTSQGDWVAFSEPDGTYAVALPVGAYFVRAIAEGYVAELHNNVHCPDEGCDLQLGTPVVVAENSMTTDLDFALETYPTISGIVREEAGRSALDGVQLLLVDQSRNVRASAISGIDGSFVLTAPIGTFRLYTSNSAGFVDQLYPGIPCPYRSCNEDDGMLFTMVAGVHQVGVDFELGLGGGLSGVVRNGSLAGVAGSVGVFSAEGPSIATVPAVKGNWALDGLPAGSYRVQFDAPGYQSQVFDNIACIEAVCDPMSGTAVVVAPPEVTFGVDATLLDADPPPIELIYLNRCGDSGCAVLPGENDAINNTSSVVSEPRVLGPWEGSDQDFAVVEACVRETFSRYRLQITTEDPGAVPHREHMLGGDSEDFGFDLGVGGISPFSCAGSPNSISFTFGNTVGKSLAKVCSVIAHEIGHQFSLDHEVHEPDHMSYFYGLPKMFTDVDSDCGTFSSVPCFCGGTKQNSHQLLRGLLGDSPLVFKDNFEADAAHSWLEPVQSHHPSSVVCGTLLRAD